MVYYKHTINHRINHRNHPGSLRISNLLMVEEDQTWLPSGELSHSNGKIHHAMKMGKSTISTGPFSIAFCMFTRGYINLNVHC